MDPLLTTVLLLSCITPPLHSFRPKNRHLLQPKTRLCIKHPATPCNPLIAAASRYKDLISSSNVFVDKTLFIRDVLRATDKYTIISTPPGWGKTLVLDMLRTFFEFELDNENEIIRDRKSYDSYALFTVGTINWTSPSQALLAPLLISDSTDLIDRHLGRYPVIYVDFKNVVGINWYEIWTKFRASVSAAFRQHAHMIDCIRKAIFNPNLDRDTMHKFELNQRRFRDYMEGVEHRRVPMKNSLRFLTEMLDWYYHRQVFLFIDDYDAPMMNIFHQPHMLERDVNRLSVFLSQFFKETFRANHHIKKSILTGTFCTENATLFPEYVRKYNPISNPFHYYFGFTESEVSAIFSHVGISDSLPKAQKWYNGYKVGYNLPTSIYTPYSVTRFLALRQFRNFYEHRQPIDMLEHMMHLKPLRYTFERLLNDYEIPLPLPKLVISHDSLLALGHLIYHDFGHNITNDLWQSAIGHLYCAGYLAAVSGEFHDSLQFIVIHLRLSNHQVQEELTNKLFFRYHYDYGVSPDMVQLVADNLIRFISTNASTSRKLAQSLKYIYHSNDNLLVDVDEPTYVTKITQFLISMLNYISLVVRQRYQFYTRVFDEPSKPDIIMVKDDLGVVLDIRFDTDEADVLLQRTKKYKNVFREHNNVHFVKYIAIDIDAEINVRICAEVQRING